MKKRKRPIMRIIIILAIVMLITISLFSLKYTGYIIKEPAKQVKFYFYDETTNCSLDGYVFIGDKLIGKSYGGYFILTQDNYKENFNNNNNISIFGRLGNCFNKDSELLFDEYWEVPKIEEYYFSGETNFNFKTKTDPHNPSKKSLIGFIQPEKVKQELKQIATRNNKLNDLSEINTYLSDKVKYAKDWEFSKETNYWQTSSETLTTEKGDCEDYGVTLLSIFKSYNYLLNCYNIVFTSHVTTFCHVNDYYIYYDNKKSEFRKEINTNQNPEEIKKQLLELKTDYLKDYGIDTSNESETKAHFAFNDKEYMEFNSNEDFINWQYSIETASKKQINLDYLEQETLALQEKYPAEIELNTEKSQELSGQLPSEKPSLKTFISENLVLVSILGIIVLLLIIILIIVNLKKSS